MTQVDEGPESPATPGLLTFGTPTSGEVLAERYELQEHINNDAFGRQVWRGIDVILRRPVAVGTLESSPRRGGSSIGRAQRSQC